MVLSRRLIKRLREQVATIEQQVISDRRDFHRHAEPGWLEFRTASLVARRLEELGYDVKLGQQVIDPDARMGIPSPERLERAWQRAHEQGGAPRYLPALRGGFTGVVGTAIIGAKRPVIGIRFDMDALEIEESHAPTHRPVGAGFVSVNDGAAHACGHDGHTAIGLSVAQVLAMMPDQLQGTIKLIFQPAEEGVRGAKSMVAAGIVDDVDYMLGAHLFSGWPLGEITGGIGGFLATTKFDAFISGAPAHAAASPHQGRNALLAAATAVLNLHGIPRHRGGSTRINVGRIEAGTARNVICSDAHLLIETRGDTTELNDYVYDYAIRILETAATMHDCALAIQAMGGAASADSDPALAHRLEQIAQDLGFAIRQPDGGGGSEDYTYMMKRVQAHGGFATNIGIGADLGGWGHHTAEFDIDERALAKAVLLLSGAVLDIMNEQLPKPENDG